MCNEVARGPVPVAKIEGLESQLDHVNVKFTNYGVESTQTAASAVSFSLGDRFRSFGELEDKLKRYEESTHEVLEKRLQNSGSCQETHGQTAS